MSDVEELRIKYGFWVVVLGLLVIVFVFLSSILVAKWTDVKDVTAALGAITGTVGTLAGAFFGVHVGAAGKEKAETERQQTQQTLLQAQQQLNRAAALLEPAQAERVFNIR